MNPRKPMMATMIMWVVVKLIQLYHWCERKMTDPDSVFAEVVFMVVMLAIAFYLITQHRSIP